jgi:2-desacetyl-2-hydroxyethyl bacteriochlorophyllide A dehydrogenase
MRAARFRGNQQIEIVDEPVPVPRPGEVLIEVAYCGLCGSDKRPYRDGFPLIPGHEVSGVVVDANGCEVDIGTRAVAYLNVYCGTCRYCRLGQTNRCPDAKGLLGWSAPWDGGYAQYMSVPAIDIIPLDPRLGLDTGVLLLDTIGTAWHGLRLGDARTAGRALVIGCGPLGLGTVAGLRAFGVPEIFASDLSQTRLEAATDLGAHPVAADEIASLFDLDLVVEAVGSGPTIMRAIRSVAPGGRVVLLGEAWAPWEFQPKKATMLKDYSLIRSWYYPLSEHAENQQMLLDGAVDPAKLISHTFPLEKLQDAFELFTSGASRKVLAAANG